MNGVEQVKNNNMKGVNITDQLEVMSIMEIACQVCGITKDDIRSQSRKRKVQVPRTIISNIARVDKGIHPEIICRTINRDRCSIYHYENVHKNSYEGWKYYRELFNKVYNAYSDIQYSKNKFLFDEDIRHLLISNGVTESKIPNVFITVTCDDKSSVIKTDYSGFSPQLDLIKQILRQANYEHKINVTLK